ncbi:MAG: hypothetical protein B7Y80_12905 [Hyphomicrobium sp. 32-62-53]|nr:MAG: hypothetical protein B7Z29_13320 [Hyphomicrobium sp. 12-62-95]OYX98935.1 MAG: hypothetical protein B7Y80_12905 [Hyphomicrobium sp. 32-62-53]
MLQNLIDYVVPFGLFLLMFVAGSEIGSSSIRDAFKSRTPYYWDRPGNSRPCRSSGSQWWPPQIQPQSLPRVC